MTRNEPTSAAKSVGWAATGGVFVALMVALVGAAPEAADSSTGHLSAMPIPVTAEVEVRVTENAIEMPATVEAGELTFVIKNGGTEAHSLQIAKGDWKVTLEQNLEPGATGNLTATLEAGTYQVSCPLSADVEKVQLRVTEPTG